MTDIKPKAGDDGEARCHGGCPYLSVNESTTAGTALAGWCCYRKSLSFVTAGSPCVPMLRRQRDEARATAERLRTALAGIVYLTDPSPCPTCAEARASAAAALAESDQ